MHKPRKKGTNTFKTKSMHKQTTNSQATILLLLVYFITFHDSYIKVAFFLRSSFNYQGMDAEKMIYT